MGTFVGLTLVDRLGRRPLLLEGGVQMATCMASRGGGGVRGFLGGGEGR